MRFVARAVGLASCSSSLVRWLSFFLGWRPSRQDRIGFNRAGLLYLQQQLADAAASFAQQDRRPTGAGGGAGATDEDTAYLIGKRRRLKLF